MAAIEKFSNAALEQIGRTIDGAATHSQFSEIFKELGLSEYDSNGSKWYRVLSVLSGRQDRDCAGNIVIVFITNVLNPVRFVGNREGFNYLRDAINQTLSFSGYEVRDDGKVYKTSGVTTLSEAEKKANRLKSLLVERQVHHDVLSFCRPELIEKNYFHSVLEATKSLADKIREKSGETEDGAPLVDKVFCGKSPLLAFNTLVHEHERSEQSGIANLMKGVFGTFRNPTAHAPKISWSVSEQDALDLLTMLSYLHRRMDGAVKTFGSVK